MLELFLSKLVTQKIKKVQNFKRRIFKVIPNIPWLKVISIIICIGIYIGFMILADVAIFRSMHVNKEEAVCIEEIDKMEEIILSHEKEIVDVASVYSYNYEIFTKKAKQNLELEIDDINVGFDKNSDEKIIISVEDSNYNSIEFTLNENKLERIEDDSKEETHLKKIISIIICIFIDMLMLVVCIFCVAELLSI